MLNDVRKEGCTSFNYTQQNLIKGSRYVHYGIKISHYFHNWTPILIPSYQSGCSFILWKNGLSKGSFDTF